MKKRSLRGFCLTLVYTIGLALVVGLPTAVLAQPCPDGDLDGYADCMVPGCDDTGLLCGDCRDDLAPVNPAALEICNGLDDDCNGLVDEGSTLLTAPLRIRDPESRAGDEFGGALAAIGDLNGDGTPELAIGSKFDDDQAGNAGTVVVVSGSDRTVWCRLTDPTGAGTDNLGWSVAGIGDVDSDAIPDIAVGVPLDNNAEGADAGKIVLFSGADCTVIRELIDPNGASSDRLGWSVAGIADVTGDGVADVVGGAPFDHTAFGDAGSVVLFSGADGTVAFKATDPLGGGSDNLGWSVAAVGDIDGDGMPDVAAGAYRADTTQGVDTGHVLLFSSADGSLVRRLVDPNGVNSDQLGYAVAGIDDLSGDGIADVLAGVVGDDNAGGSGAGAVLVFSGADGSVVRTLLDPAGAVQDQLGFAVASVPDANGDGMPDVAAAAPFRDTPQDDDVGRVLLFSGADGTVLRTFADAEGAFEDQLGTALAVAELNGDGVPDLVAGAPFAESEEEVSVGQAILFVVQADCDGDGVVPIAGDCDDGDASNCPGNPETCDGQDNDCDLVADEDADGDGFDVCSDCGPSSPLVYPGAPERCNGVDDDCNLVIDDGSDVDVDGVEAPCDCDDDDPNVFPGQVETCNGLDEDCDRMVDEGFAQETYAERVIDPEQFAGDEMGYDVAAVGDVNSDGISEFVVGVPNDDEGLGGSGSVLLFSGSDRSPICRMTRTSPANSDQLGYSVAGIGDVDADGVPDVAAGAIFADPSGGNSGAVVLFSGADCSEIRVLSDPDGAGNDNLGWSVSGIDDISGDGIPDILAGSYGDDVDGENDAGSVLAFSGADGTVIHKLTDADGRFRDRLGASVAGLGDVDLDGVPDIAAGAPEDDTLRGSQAGTVAVFSGADGSRIHTLRDPDGAGSDRLGFSVAGIGDVNGDDIPDIVAGAPQNDDGVSNGGAVLLFSGADGSRIRQITAAVSSTAYLGHSVASIRDVDGDGIPDVVAGARADDSQAQNAGSVLLLSGADGSLIDRLTDPLAGPDDNLGFSLAVIPDLSGDGIPEILAGAELADSAEEADTGRVVLFSIGSDCDGDGQSPFGGDCDDGNPSRRTGQLEVCDAIDNDCDLAVDEDQDGDGADACADCDPDDPSIYPGAPERCNGKDDDCDTVVDNGTDGDLDGVETPCDCNDEDDTILPGAPEVCDRTDNDCNGLVDETAAQPATAIPVQDPDGLFADEYGIAVASIGDLTGDGVSELAVGAWLAGSGNSGKIVVHSGSDLSKVCDAVDTLAGFNETLGTSVAGVGDVSGDGIPDFAAGATSADGTGFDTGVLVVFSGADCTTYRRLTLPDEQADDELGESVAAFPDVTGDGVPEILGGAWRDDTPLGGGNAGSAALFDGATGAQVLRLIDPDGRSGDQLGSSVAAIGDVDGDGIPDIAAGAPLDDHFLGGSAGSVSLFSGADGSRIRKLIDASAPSGGARLGTSVAAIGDVNADGISDIVAGAPRDATEAGTGGAVVVFSGADGTVLHKLTDPLTENGDQLGYRVIALPDVSGDGVPDVAAAVWLDDTGGGVDAGSVVVFSVADETVLRRFSYALGTEGDRLATSIAMLGDLSGDGMPEILAGAPEAERADDGAVGLAVVFSMESDCDGDGVSPYGTDCDDADAANFPGNPELCDAQDNNCNALVDEDEDGDGVGICQDCAPTNPQIYLGAPERCNGLDDDCDTDVDEGDDLDGDGFQTPCDCNDDNDAIRPGVVEACDHVDTNCNGAIDEGFPAPIAQLKLVDDFETAADGFGGSVANLGDVNGDGFHDFVVGVPGNDDLFSASGKAVVYSGATRLRICNLYDPDAAGSDNLGGSTAGIGDVTGDGVPDIVVGSGRDNTTAGNDAGSVLLFSGADCSFVRKLEDPQGLAGNQLGDAVTGLSDISGDGVPDVAAGAPFDDSPVASNSGSATVWSGADGSVLFRLLNPAGRDADRMGQSIAAIGDVDADGIPDIAVGADGDSTVFASGAGTVSLFSGADGSLIRTLRNPNAASTDLLGISVAGIEDLNGDGIGDVVAGAYRANNATANDAGSVFLFSGADGTVLLELFDPDGMGGAWLGNSVAVTPDLDGDGLQDVVAGAPFEDGVAGTDTGSAVIFSSSSGAVLRKLTDAEGAADDELGLALAVAGDINQGGATEILAGVAGDDGPPGSGSGSVVLFAFEPDCDGDGQLPLFDCNDLAGGLQSEPGEVVNLRFTDTTTLTWDVPVDSGGDPSLLVYDVIRSEDAIDLVDGAICLESQDGSDRQATDGDVILPGVPFYYQVRAGNPCGLGDLGSWSDQVTRREGRVCP
ncbi:MAG: hypothetical protein GY716_03270 [bacterium]|nr:hypothetical protein [bacterium]